MRSSDLAQISVSAAPRRRLRLLLACSAVALSLAAGQAMAATINVANQTDWNTAVAAVAAAGSGTTVVVNITSGFTLTSSLAQLQASNANVTVNITGNGQTIDGGSTYQGVQVSGANALNVTISNLTISATKAVGGTGANGQNGYFSGGLSYGSGGGGGGGLGAGGGLFVGGGATVSLSSVSFTNDNATGGAGGAGGSAQNTASSGTGGNGGDGGALNAGATVGGGGAGGLGGNTGTQGTTGTAGGTLGAGGGGGGGSGTTFSVYYTLNNTGGAGNSAGPGGPGGDGVTNNNGAQGPGADGGSGGSGGSAQGGAVFVASGGTLTIVDSAITGSTVAGGAGGSAGVGAGPSAFNGVEGGTGAAAGAGIYVNGTTANVGVSSGTVTYANTIGGDGGAGAAVNKTGAGALALTAANNYTGGTTLSQGTLVVGANAALGATSGALSMAAGTTLSFSGGNFTVANAIHVSGDSIFTPAASTTQILSGVISQSGVVDMQGPGTLVLSGVNTYTGGTLVSGGVLMLSGGGELGATSGTLGVSGGTLDLGATTQTTGALTLTGGTIQNGTLTSSAFNTQSGTITAVLAGAGQLTQNGAGTTTLSGANTYTGGTALTQGTLVVGANTALGAASGALTMASGTTLSFSAGSFTVANQISVAGDATFTAAASTTQTLSGVISDGASAGHVIAQGASTLVLSGVNTYTGGTTVSGGATLRISGAGTFGATTGALGVSGSTLNLGGTTQTTGVLTLTSGSIQSGTLTSSAFNTQSGTVSAVLAGAGRLTQSGSGTTTLSGVNTYTGGTTVTGGTLTVSGSGTLGAASGTTTLSGGTLDLGGTTQIQAGFTLSGGTLKNGVINAPTVSTGGVFNSISGATSLTTTAGVTTLTGVNTYTGGTNVNGGTLNVTGSLADPAVNAGGVLMGTGSVGATQVNTGGVFMPGDGTPGSSMAVNGALTFQSGGVYRVQVNPTSASFAAVTGAATLGGATVNAVFASGSYVSKTYKILSATGGVSGAFASSVANTNLPSTFSTTLSYDANDAYLNLALSFVPSTFALPNGLNLNQTAVGAALTNSFNSAGGIPLLYGTLTAAQLTQADGELATGAQQTTFDAMGQFVGLMQTNGAQSSSPGRRLNVWAADEGRSRTTQGDAATGSNKATGQVYGGAIGADYLLTPDTIVGVALAEGGTTFSVSGLAGSGRSTLTQAGGYVRRTVGVAYVSAAAAYGWQDITTNRTLAISGVDQLRSTFGASAYSGRLEGGFSGQLSWTRLTPYAALQSTVFDAPAYAERVLTGSNTFALGHGKRGVTDTSSEMGVRTENTFAKPDGVVTFGTSVAWAHDFTPNRAAQASLLALPNAAFVVNGAAQAYGSALTTASLGRKWTNGWSVSASFQGDFSRLSTSYGGLGVIRYAW